METLASLFLSPRFRLPHRFRGRPAPVSPYAPIATDPRCLRSDEMVINSVIRTNGSPMSGSATGIHMAVTNPASPRGSGSGIRTETFSSTPSLRLAAMMPKLSDLVTGGLRDEDIQTK